MIDFGALGTTRRVRRAILRTRGESRLGKALMSVREMPRKEAYEYIGKYTMGF